MKRRLIIVSLILGLIFIVIGLFYFFNDSNRNLEFSSSECVSNGDLRFLQGIRNIKWIDDHTVEILARVSTNCNSHVKSGSYKLDENNLYLDYKVKSNLLLSTMCNCNSDLVYRISNLEKKDYEIILRGYEFFEASCEGFEEIFLQTCCKTLAEDRGLPLPEEDCKWGLYEGECKIICE